MRKTLSKVHMQYMLTIDTLGFLVTGGVFKAPPSRINNFLKYTGLDKVNVPNKKSSLFF